MEKETKEYYKGLLEALLFLSSEPVKLAHLAESASIEKVVARELLDELVLDYSEKDGGIVLKEIANGYQFQTNDKFHKVLGTIFKEKRRETLSKSTLDTLAIVAYKQPITLPEIDEIRGVSSRAMITTLISKKLVKAVGQKEVPGRPTLYGTTNDFLMHFGLNKLSDLPTPVEVKELNLDNLDDLKIEDEEPEDQPMGEEPVEDVIHEVPVETEIHPNEKPVIQENLESEVVEDTSLTEQKSNHSEEEQESNHSEEELESNHSEEELESNHSEEELESNHSEEEQESNHSEEEQIKEEPSL